MPALSFDGASGFTISGGNFCEIGGSMNTFNFGGDADTLPSGASLGAAAASIGGAGASHGRQGRRRRRRQDSLPSATIHSVPSTPAATSSNVSPPTPPAPTSNVSSPLSTTPTPATSVHSPLGSASTVSSDSDDDIFSLRRSSSRYSTPPTDNEEHQHLGTSGLSPTSLSPSRPPAAQQQQDIELLTPLTDTLGLRRFTPSTQASTLSPYQTPQAATLSPYQTPQALSREVRTSTPNQPTSLTPVPLQLSPRAPSTNPGPPPPIPPRPASHASYRPPPSPNYALSPLHQQSQTPLGPPPPVPPRPESAVSEAPPPPSPLYASRSTTLPAFSFPEASTPAPQQQPEPEDPSVIFARLRAQRPDTKGYASGLPVANVVEYTPSNSAHTFSPPPPPQQFRAGSLPLPPGSVTSHVTGLSPIPEAPELPAPQASQHWTPNSISNWTNNVRQDDSDSMSRTTGPPPQVPPYPPSYPHHPHHPPHPPVHANTYPFPSHQGFQNPQYNQPWPTPAPPPPPPPHHQYSYPNQHNYGAGNSYGHHPQGNTGYSGYGYPSSHAPSNPMNGPSFPVAQCW